MKNMFKTWFLSFLRLLFPRQCVVRGEPLQKGEDAIRLRCNMSLPRMEYHLRMSDPVERMSWGKLPLERVAFYFFYQKGGDFRRTLYPLKYGERKDLGKIMERFMVVELLESSSFRDIGVIMPVPLHPRKQRMRGYNQSEHITRGITAVTGLSLDTSSVVRKRHTETQTSKSAYERWGSVDDTFRLDCPGRLIRRHVLLMGGMSTTGAITTVCADALRNAERMCIGVLILAVTDY